MVAFERARRALQLRGAGASYERIAHELGFTHRSAARKLVQRTLAGTIQEAADELRRLELERLDRLQEMIWSQAAAGRLAAVDRVLKIMERRARLLGLDAPARQAVNVITEDMIDGEIRRMDAEIARLEGASSY